MWKRKKESSSLSEEERNEKAESHSRENMWNVRKPILILKEKYCLVIWSFSLEMYVDRKSVGSALIMLSNVEK